MGGGAITAAIVAVSISFFDMLPAVRPNLARPVAVGFSRSSPDGLFWTWSVLRGKGCIAVNAGIYRDAEHPDRERGRTGSVIQLLAPPTWSYVSEHPLPPSLDFPKGVILSVSDSAFGWPWLCLTHRVELLELQPISSAQVKLETTAGLAANSGELQQVPRVTRGACWPTPLSTEVNWHTGYVPSHILWPGFLLNTLFWSCVIASPFWLRRGFVAWKAAHRRRGGRCPACGYARAGLAADKACPECGAGSIVSNAA
jgi:hypothetical protein